MLRNRYPYQVQVGKLRQLNLCMFSASFCLAMLDMLVIAAEWFITTSGGRAHIFQLATLACQQTTPGSFMRNW
jgi:hypothetical protein